MTTYTAHFQAEAWAGDQPIPADPQGPESWDCTAFAREHASYLAGLIDDYDVGAVVDVADVFKADPAAPQWVRDWPGPFTIRIQAH